MLQTQYNDLVDGDLVFLLCRRVECGQSSDQTRVNICYIAVTVRVPVHIFSYTFENVAQLKYWGTTATN